MIVLFGLSNILCLHEGYYLLQYYDKPSNYFHIENFVLCNYYIFNNLTSAMNFIVTLLGALI